MTSGYFCATPGAFPVLSALSRQIPYNIPMDLLTREELKSLSGMRPGLCVSLFLPTHRAGKEILQDPIRLKNLLRQAVANLTAKGVRRARARELLMPALHLVQRKTFWSYQADGLALFLSSGFFRYLRLPLQFQELVVVTDRFHVKPLLPLFLSDGQFFVLALSQKNVRLFEGTRYKISEVDLEGAPRSLHDVLKYDQVEQHLQAHTRTGGPQGKRAAIFHGQGEGEEDAKKKLGEFFRQVDKGLQALLGDRRLPLVLAAVEYLIPLYRAASGCKCLLEEGIVGNPETLTPDELHAAAWNIARKHFDAEQLGAKGQYREASRTQKASSRITEVLPAAFHGRVDCMFVAVGEQQWGAFDPEESAVTVHDERQPGDEDLLDLAAVQTILHSGRVYALPPAEVPDGASIAATFRY